METDLLVKLYDLPNPDEAYCRVKQKGGYHSPGNGAGSQQNPALCP